MGCNCGSGAKTTQYEYVFTAMNGETKTYRTEIEARAAAVRSGGGTVKQQEVKK